ncbi:unnamed protein product [Periconia digitata]|uniref:Uncharacterized protein n=1 Tax=Periconia digitata TaxID=1303443 RepID=A0A9W4U3C6_9PLEO|nr:unnamed protein product [Periconia digitata]
MRRHTVQFVIQGESAKELPANTWMGMKLGLGTHGPSLELADRALSMRLRQLFSFFTSSHDIEIHEIQTMNNYPPPTGMGMGPPPGMPPPSKGSLWSAVKAGDKYYYVNNSTKQTTWEKPEELMTDEERALANTNYVEYTSANGQKYWAHKETRETTWTMPDEVAENMKRIQAQRPPPPTGSNNAWAAGPAMIPPPFEQTRNAGDRPIIPNPRERYMPDRPDRTDRRDRDDRDSGYAGERMERQNFVSASNELQFPTPQDAEAAFMKVLKQLKAQPDWTWSQTVRAGIKDPHWRAIPDPDKREEAFRKYCDELRAQEKNKEQDRQKKLRTDFMAMLASHPEIKHYTRWKTARPILEEETIFRSAKDDDERRHLFDEYIMQLRRSNAEKEAEEKKTALDDLAKLLQDMDLEPFTRWQAVDQNLDRLIANHGDKFQSIHRLDVLTTFESHIKQLQRDHNERVQAEHQAKRRVERKNRDAFKDLLEELRHSGKLRYGTKWKDIHDDICDDPRYIAMLGQKGSSPLDLFWDMIGTEENKFRTLRRTALNALEEQQYEVTTATPFEEFSSIIRSSSRTANIDTQSMRSIYDYVLAKVKRREDDDRRNEEIDERWALDSFRSMLKRLEPPIILADDWESVRPRVEKTKEYLTLKSDSLRQIGFDKFYRRLKDRETDQPGRGDRPRREREPRDRERGSRQERDRERERNRRDRDREYRNGNSDSHRRHRTRTRSPENDPYAAERRQAQQDREARYRNNDSTGLSPQPLRRERERERDIDRYSRRGSSDHYGRERREREVERERSFVGRGDPLSRADPREQSVSELDYGDGSGRPAASRRRRESDESSARRDNKRARFSPRLERKSKTPVPEATKEVDRAIRSGSEEGEIEED